jgi:flagellar basal body-associated protein FliL
MKKVLLVVLLVAVIGLIAFASLKGNNSQTKKEPTEKKTQSEKKERTRSCMFS